MYVRLLQRNFSPHARSELPVGLTIHRPESTKSGAQSIDVITKPEAETIRRVEKVFAAQQGEYAAPKTPRSQAPGANLRYR